MKINYTKDITDSNDIYDFYDYFYKDSTFDKDYAGEILQKVINQHFGGVPKELILEAIQEKYPEYFV